MSLFDIFRRTSTPEELYKKKKDAEFIESLKEISITVTTGGAITVNGLSEYGAKKMLSEGREPKFNEKVMTKEGELISWADWKEVVEEALNKGDDK